MASNRGSMEFVSFKGFIYLRLCILIILGIQCITFCNGHHTGDSKDSKHSGHEKLILILADGVRYDYVNDADLKGFPRMFKEGVRAKHVVPIYPANSYPNWYTIVTGLYAESHGFVQNYMYDEKVNDTFLMIPYPNATNSYWWNEAEPLWVTAEKHSIKTMMYWWGGCEVKIRDTVPSKCEKYIPYWNWHGEVDKEVEKTWSEILKNFEDGYQLALVYYEAVDANGHRFGPDANETKEAVRRIDNLLDKLQDELKKQKMDDQVSIVVVSDHGMKNVGPDSKVTKISLNGVVESEDIQMILDRGSLSMIRPHPGKVDKVIKDIEDKGPKGLKVYKKENIPEEYHLKNNNRTQEILVVVEPGYFLDPYDDPLKQVPSKTGNYSGFHGYDPNEEPEMYAIMYARGPILKKGFESDPIHMVDHYNVLCHLIGLDPHPNNGSWDRVKDMFESTGMMLRPLLWIYLGSLLLSCLFTRRKLV